MLRDQAWQSDDVGVGPKIPQALEKILQLKEIRQEQLTAAPTGENAVNALEPSKLLKETEGLTLCVLCSQKRKTTTRPMWT